MQVLIATHLHALMHFGGLAESCDRVAESLAARGNDVTVVVVDAGRQRWPRELRPPDMGGRLYRMVAHPSNSPVRQLTDGAFDARVRDAILASVDAAPDVLVAFGADPIGVGCALAAGTLRRPLVVAIRGRELDRGSADEGTRSRIARVFEAATSAAFVCHGHADRARAEFGYAGPSHITYCGIQDSVLSTSWRSPRRHAPIFGAIGVFRPHKGVGLFVGAAARMSSLRPRCVLVGMFHKDGDAGASCPIPCTGLVSRDAALMALNDLDVFVAPSISDGCPNALLHAMAAGRAVIASKAGAMGDLLVDGVNARILSSLTDASMVRALEELDSDADLRARLGLGARQSAEVLTVDREVRAWERVLAGAQG